MVAVLIRIDEAGEWPVIVREDEELLTDAGVRWRLVAECDDIGQARALLQLLHQRRKEEQERRWTARAVPPDVGTSPGEP